MDVFDVPNEALPPDMRTGPGGAERTAGQTDADDTAVATRASTASTVAVAPLADRVPQTAETRRLYAADWRAFALWCRRHRHTPLPAAPETVASWLDSLSGSLAPGALGRKAAAIADRHRRAGHAAPSLDPAVRAVLRTAREAKCEQTARRGSGFVAEARRRRRQPDRAELARMAARCPGDLAGLRDRALLVLAAAGITAGQMLGLDREHLQLSSHQVTLELTMSQEGTRVVALARGAMGATCPVQALDQWLHASDTRFGPVFRKVDRWGNVEHQRLRADGLRRIWQRRGPAAASA